MTNHSFKLLQSLPPQALNIFCLLGRNRGITLLITEFQPSQLLIFLHLLLGALWPCSEPHSHLGCPSAMAPLLSPHLGHVPRDEPCAGKGLPHCTLLSTGARLCILRAAGSALTHGTGRRSGVMLRTAGRAGCTCGHVGKGCAPVGVCTGGHRGVPSAPK